MAPNRQPTSILSVSSPVRHSFLNALAESYFQDFMLEDKSIICEVEVQPGATASNILNILEQRNWGSLADLGGGANVSVVREFYANLRAYGDIGPIMVRGRIVDFSEEVINTALGLEAPIDDEYGDMIREGPNYEMILGYMAGSGIAWAHLKEWCRFIQTNLIPTTHTTKFTNDRAVLLFCILAQHSVNIGRLIHWNIASYCRRTQLSAHIHPVLITRLCAAAGVDMSVPDELWIWPAVYGWAHLLERESTDYDYQQERVDVWERNTSLNFSPIPPTPGTVASVSQSSHAYATTEMERIMTNISTQQNRMIEIITRIEQKMDHLIHLYEDDDEDRAESS